jgi:DNA repair exonuclease SbcCD ATPase subunit
MAEEPTSVDNAPATPEPGQPQASEGTAPQSQPKQEKVNLFDLPEFKGYQAQFNRTVSGLQAELQQLRQAQAQATMSGMDDLEKANYLLQEKEREIAGYREAMEQQRIQQQRWQDVQSLSELSGAPTSVLQHAETYDEAVKLSIQWMKENGASAKEIKDAKAEANRVDLGNGGASTPQDRESRERQELLKRGDTRALFLKILEG